MCICSQEGSLILNPRSSWLAEAVQGWRGGAHPKTVDSNKMTNSHQNGQEALNKWQKQEKFDLKKLWNDSRYINQINFKTTLYPRQSIHSLIDPPTGPHRHSGGGGSLPSDGNESPNSPFGFWHHPSGWGGHLVTVRCYSEDGSLGSPLALCRWGWSCSVFCDVWLKFFICIF